MADQATGFTQATAADFGPTTFYGNRTPNDPAVLLEGLPLVRMDCLRQRALDLHSTLPTFGEISAASLVKIGHANRIADLTRHKSLGGFNLDASAPQVLAERKKLERAEQELVRLQTLQEVRTVRWNAVKQLEHSVTDWLLHGGIPGGCVLQAVEDAPLSELLVKSDGGRIETAVERCRMRLRELAAEAHRVRSSPYPSSVAKAAARELISRLADRGAPNLDNAIEHGQPITFATTRLTALVHNVETRGAVAMTEAFDALATMCWLLREQMISKVCAGLDEIADDTHALSSAEREQFEAQISRDILAVERAECSLIWAADANGEAIDFRPTTSPESVLGVRLVTVPANGHAATSIEHAFDLLQPGR